MYIELGIPNITYYVDKKHVIGGNSQSRSNPISLRIYRFTYDSQKKVAKVDKAK